MDVVCVILGGKRMSRQINAQFHLVKECGAIYVLDVTLRMSPAELAIRYVSKLLRLNTAKVD